MTVARGVVDKFAAEYYSDVSRMYLSWMGREIVKPPTDMWTMQELLWEKRPEVIVECGTYKGGSALFYAHLYDLMGVPGEIVTIDIAYDSDFDYPEHERVKLVLGKSSLDPEVLEIVKEHTSGKQTMVILDSDHSCDHVLQELRAYHRFVSVGQYLLVEDTNKHGYHFSVHGKQNAGPADAVAAWQPTNHGFTVDRSRERFLLTFHPGGFLLKTRNTI